MGVAATPPPGLAAINPQGFGAGVGRVKPYYEQGNWYRGGAVQMLFIDWLYGEQNQRAADVPRRHVASRLGSRIQGFRSGPQLPRVDWGTGLATCRSRTSSSPSTARGGLCGLDAGSHWRSDDPAHTRRSAWYKGGLYHDDMVINVPGLYFMSWYDVSIGPNLALFNHVRATASPAIGSSSTR